jgi:hypothetical protein
MAERNTNYDVVADYQKRESLLVIALIKEIR